LISAEFNATLALLYAASTAKTRGGDRTR